MNDASAEGSLIFDAHRFLERLDAGEFDGRLSVTFKDLTKEQLEQVCYLLARRSQG